MKKSSNLLFTLLFVSLSALSVRAEEVVKLKCTNGERFSFPYSLSVDDFDFVTTGTNSLMDNRLNLSIVASRSGKITITDLQEPDIKKAVFSCKKTK